MLSVEEITLIKMYSGLNQDRRTLIESLESVIPHFTEQEEEMRDLSNDVIKKLTFMSDVDFATLNLDTALDTESEENQY